MKTLNNQSKNRFGVTLHKDGSDFGQLIYDTHTFNKNEIECAFINACEVSNPGDVIEYWKRDAKKYHPHMLTVENRKGKLSRWVHKGNKTYYASFNFFGKKANIKT